MRHACEKIAPMIPAGCEMRDMATFRFRGQFELGQSYAVKMGNEFLVLLEEAVFHDVGGVREITAYVRFAGIIRETSAQPDTTTHRNVGGPSTA